MVVDDSGGFFWIKKSIYLHLTHLITTFSGCFFYPRPHYVYNTDNYRRVQVYYLHTW